MKKTFILITSLVLLLASCKNPVFLPNPNIDNPHTDNNLNDNSWHAPRELKSTQGNKKKITLSWLPVSEADFYIIYMGDSPSEKFERCGETKNSKETSFTMNLESSYDKYFKVSACMKKNDGIVESDMSNITRATTLAKPIISSIEGLKEKADSSLVVSWYMSNVDAYLDTVHYNVICYNDKKEEVQKKENIIGDLNKVIFENLNPNTNYFFKVEAYNKVNDFEESDLYDRETAHRLKPDAATNLTVEKGICNNKITLSFVLPNEVEVSLGNNQFAYVPIYFKIYRRLLKEGDNQEPFKLIKNNFGISYLDDKKTIDYEHVDFGSGPVVYGDLLNSDNKTVTYTDNSSDLVRDEQYEYKVQSFAYIDRANPISSDTSHICNTGWLLPNFTFDAKNINYEFKDKDGNVVQQSDIDSNKINDYTKNNAKVNFSFNFTTFEIPYIYQLYEYKREINNDEYDGGTLKLEASSPAEVSHYVRLFDKLDAESGYYHYNLIILSPDRVPLGQFNSIGESLVTSSMKIPEIGDIKVTTGYEDRIELKFKYNTTFIYTLEYRDGESKINSVIKHDELIKNLDENSEFITYNDKSAMPGVERTYKLTIESSGFKVTSPSLIGIIPPKLELKPIYFYDKARIKIMNPVEGESYTAKGQFVDNEPNYEIKQINTEDPILFDFVVKPIDSTVQIEENVISSNIAGKNINIIVETTRKLKEKTYNSTQNTEPEPIYSTPIKIETPIITSYIGQALLNTTVSKGTMYDSIELSWNKIAGTNKYLILREQYYIGDTSLDTDLKLETSQPDRYAITLKEDGTIDMNLYNGVDTIPISELNGAVSISFENGIFKLIDKYRPLNKTEDITQWKKTQSEMKWGAPYKYTVVPILDTDQFITPELKEDNSIAIGNLSIKDIKSVKGGTKGYGWNVAATKGDFSESNSTDLSNHKTNNAIQISWSTPYFNNNEEFLIYRHDLSDLNSKWQRIGTSSSTQYIDKANLKPGVMYEYAVKVNPPNNEAKIVDELFVYNDNVNNILNASGFILPNATVTEVSRNDVGEGNINIKFMAVEINEKENEMFDGYVIQVRNNNLDNLWHDILTVPIDTDNKTKFNFDITLNTKNTEDSLYPNGLLKVLRDYKLYFRVRLYKDKFGEKIYSKVDENFIEGMDTDYVKWGARQISAEEMLKMVNLVISQGMQYVWVDKNSVSYDSSIIKYTRYNTIFTSHHGGQFDFKPYHLATKTKAGIDVSSISVKGTLYTEAWGLYEPSLYNTGDGSITFNANTNQITDLYNGSIKYYGEKSKKSGHMVIEYNGKTVEKQYNDEKGTFCPFILGYGGATAGVKREFQNNNEEWR